jgi:hypothetical protein
MPTPLHLSDEEMDLLLALAAPIDQRQRTQFLTEVTAAIEEEAARTSVGPGLVHRWRARFRGAFSIRRSCPTQARRRAPKGRSSKLEHYGRGRDLSLVERSGFFGSASVGPSQRKHRLAWPGCRCC